MRINERTLSSGIPISQRYDPIEIDATTVAQLLNSIEVTSIDVYHEPGNTKVILLVWDGDGSAEYLKADTSEWDIAVSRRPRRPNGAHPIIEEEILVPWQKEGF
jgi:hypothetical protein